MGNQILVGKRVLVVEDEMLVMMAIEDMLSDLGCTSITIAANVETALGCIAANKFDLATLDVNLNGVRSYPIAKALNARQIPFPFSTGYGEHGIDEGFGNRTVLNKPYSCLQFNEAINDLLAEGRPQFWLDRVMGRIHDSADDLNPQLPAMSAAG